MQKSCIAESRREELRRRAPGTPQRGVERWWRTHRGEEARGVLTRALRSFGAGMVAILVDASCGPRLASKGEP